MSTVIEPSAFDLILNLVPADQRDAFKVVYEKHAELQNENDPMYILVLSLLIFQKHIETSSEKITSEIRQLKIQQENIVQVLEEKKTSRILFTFFMLVLSILAGIGTFYVYVYHIKPGAPVGINEGSLSNMIELNHQLKSKF